MRRLLALATSALAFSVALTGCEFHGIYSLPLPGGAATGAESYTVVVKFTDVTALVPQSAVKVNNVTVGNVTDIELEGWHAKVTCRLKGDVRLPDNAIAKVAQTSLLGEKYVQITQPPQGFESSGRLGDGDVIPLARTSRYPEVEQVLSALSLLLNGGGLAQLQTINRELNAALNGREAAIRDLLHQLDTFVGSLDKQKAEIVRALEGLEELSGKLAKEKETIAKAVDTIEPALEILNRQQEDLTKMLVALSDLGEVATRVIDKSKEDTLTNLRNLRPILDRLEKSGDDLAQALPLLLTFPFPSTAEAGIHGDYTNLSITADLTLNTLIHNLDLSGSAPSLPPLPLQSLPGSQSKRGQSAPGATPGSQDPGSAPDGQDGSSSTPSPESSAPGGEDGDPDDDEGGLLDLLSGGSQ